MSAREPDPLPLDAELERLARTLDAAARQEERDIAAAAALPDPRERMALERRMDGLWEGLDRRRRRARRLVLVGMLVPAAAIVLAFFLFRAGGPDAGPGGDLLGGSEVEIFAPPASGAWERIEWRGPERAYVLSVIDRADGRTLLGPVRVVGDAHALDPGLSAGWPAIVVIQLEWRLPDGAVEHESREVVLRR